jgi:hypothetical protein
VDPLAARVNVQSQPVVGRKQEVIVRWQEQGPIRWPAFESLGMKYQGVEIRAISTSSSEIAALETNLD